MPTALLAGAFGQHNPGDEALLDAFVQALPGWRKVATSSDPQATQERGVEAVPSSRPREVAQSAARADAVILAGGTVFKTLSPRVGRGRHDLLVKAVTLAAGSKALGKPVAAVGLGAGELPDNAARMLVRALVRFPDLLVLRDEESARVLSESGAVAPFRVGADPAWTLLDAPPAEHQNGSDTVVVALSHLGAERELAGRLALALAPLADEHGLSFKLQPWQVGGTGPDDVELARDLSQLLPGQVEILSPPRDLAEARALFAGARMVVGLRFHALVAAASAGVPFVALAHEAKLTGLARRLHQPAVSVGHTPEEIRAAVRAACDGPAPSPAAVRGEIARAEESFRLMRLLLSGGRTPEATEVTGLPLVPEPWSQ